MAYGVGYVGHAGGLLLEIADCTAFCTLTRTSWICELSRLFSIIIFLRFMAISLSVEVTFEAILFMMMSLLNKE